MAKKVIYSEKRCSFCSKIIIHKYGEGMRDWDRRRFCNHRCFSNWNVGENNSLYKRGFRIRPDGYVRDSKDRYIHRLVMENKLGRKLGKNEHVHHIDHNPSNNREENLVVLTNNEHRKLEMLYAKRNEIGQFC